MDSKSMKCMLFATIAGVMWGISEIILVMALSSPSNNQVFVILTFRAAFQVLFLLPITIIKQKTLFPADKEYIFVFLRSISQAIGCTCIYVSLYYISPLQVTVISSVKPFFVMGIAHFWLKEKISRLVVFTILLVTIGVFLVSEPTFWIHHGFFKGSAINNVIGIGLVSLSTITATVYICSCRKLSKTSIWIILLWISLFSLVGSGILSLFFSNWREVELLSTIGWSALISGVILVAEGLLTTALVSHEAVNIAICLNTQIPTTLIGQWLILNIVPSIDIWVGTSVICFCLILNYFHDYILKCFRDVSTRYFFGNNHSSEEKIEIFNQTPRLS